MKDKSFSMRDFQENIWWIIWSLFMILQIIASFLFYNLNGFLAVSLLGWLILITGGILGGIGVSDLQKMGNIESQVGQRKKFGVGTTILVDRGSYSVCRHPQYFSWMILNVALTLITQSWIVAILGCGSMISIYLQARQDDHSLIKKFGDDYTRYMKSVPRMNLLIGVFRQFHKK